MTACTTSWRICRRSVSAALQRCAAWALSSLAVVGVLAAQDAKVSWTTYHGDYSGRRHSSLTQMTLANVHHLTLACALSTCQMQAVKATRILANAVSYISASYL